jgi:hypothetical protein
MIPCVLILFTFFFISLLLKKRLKDKIRFAVVNNEAEIKGNVFLIKQARRREVQNVRSENSYQLLSQ